MFGENNIKIKTMHKINFELKQGTSEWLAAKTATIGSSKMKNIIDIRKNGQLKSKDTLITAASDIISEIKTDISNDSDYESEAMEWGTYHEMQWKKINIGSPKYPDAFECGLITNDQFKYLAMSPDMLRGSDRNNPTIGTEIKCPSSKNFVKWKIKKEIPSDHIVQVMTYFVTIESLETMEFLVFDPRFVNSEYKITITRKENQQFIENMKVSIISFCGMVDEWKKLF